ncbi:MAG: S8 family serine peptidase [Chitinophaga sp.]|uniref:S8 family serine peptidase n=1 Tax=Chitinophaga sp. TaxID=1869181 RepID=UPI001B04AC53|nr:S8 family serine peptidase [Chitinophaga sp.]MBO9731483.1 S8 family serine peptidase [Chitinophaga sp.]
MINVKVTLPLRVRKGPGKSYDVVANVYPSGQVITMDGIEEGEDLKGINKWYYRFNDKQEKQSYWAGRLTETAGTLPWGIAALKVADIWNGLNEFGQRAKVAVLDTGFNIANTDISSGVKAYQSFLIDHPEQSTLNDMNDEFGHGSLCASLIGSRNKLATVGYAPECELYIAKISARGTASYPDIIKGIRWAIEKEVDIISVSYGGFKQDNDLNTIVAEAVNKGIVVVASIGDDFTFSNLVDGKFPALCPESIAVGATDPDNKLAKISFLHQKTEIYAPGEKILAYTLNLTPDDCHDTAPENCEGTSQSAAIVAGICALIISRHKALNKSFTASDIKQLITTLFDPVQESAGLKLISPSKIFATLKT